MSLSSVLQIGLTGLVAAEQMVSRASNNLANPNALRRSAASPNSGLPVESDPGQDGAATVLNGDVDTSSMDIGESLVDLLLASTQFRTNVIVLEVADELSAELAGIKRVR